MCNNRSLSHTRLSNKTILECLTDSLGIQNDSYDSTAYNTCAINETAYLQICRGKSFQVNILYLLTFYGMAYTIWLVWENRRKLSFASLRFETLVVKSHAHVYAIMSHKFLRFKFTPCIFSLTNATISCYKYKQWRFHRVSAMRKITYPWNF